MKIFIKLFAIYLFLFDTSAFSLETISITDTRLVDSSDNPELIDGIRVFGGLGDGGSGAIGPIRQEKQKLSLEEKKFQNKQELDKLAINRGFDFLKSFFNFGFKAGLKIEPNVVNNDGNVVKEGGKKVCISFRTDEPCFQRQIIQSDDFKVVIMTPLVPRKENGEEVLAALRKESVYFFINGQTGPILESQFRNAGLDVNLKFNCSPSVAHGDLYQIEAQNLFIDFRCQYGQLIETGVSCKQPDKFESGAGRSCTPRNCFNIAHGTSELVDRGFCSSGRRQAEYLRCSFGALETYFIGHSCGRGFDQHGD